MVDYDKASGDGLLRIRDLGSVVEFWVKPAYSSFWWTDLDFNWTANGTTTAVKADFDGNAWKKVGSRTVSSSTTVTFKLLEATGTSSLGGPTTHSVEIDRGTVPPTPDPVVISLVTNTTLRTTFTDNGNGGVAIDLWQIARNTSNTVTGAQIISVGSDRLQDWTGLVSGTTQYFWARVHNAKGYSGWSSVRSVTMLRRPFPPSQPNLTSIEQTSLNVQATDGATGGSPITSREYRYGPDPSPLVGTGTTVVYDGNAPAINLPPGRHLYFWARTINAYGASDWSPEAEVTLIAGATISDEFGVIRRAVPWVNVAGVWKVARPWGKIAGNWNKSAT